MARSFNGSSDILEISSTPVTASPLSISCWFYPLSTAADRSLITVYDGNISVDSFGLGLNTSDQVQAGVAASGSTSLAATTATVSTNNWYHAGGVFASSTSRSAYLNGANKATNTESRTPSGVDRIAVGAINLTVIGFYSGFNGYIGEGAIWNVALTDDEMAILGKGFSPLFVRPASVVCYWNFIRTLQDTIGGYDLSATGSAVVAHPPAIYPVVPASMHSVFYALDLNSGSYAVTGQNPSTLANRALGLDAGSYSTTGQTLSPLANRILGLETGVYTKSGQSPDLLADRILGLDSGSYAVTGNDPTLLVGRILALDAGSYTISGQAADLLVSRLLDLTLGSYTVSGLDATLTYTPLGAYTLNLDAGSYTITGLEPGLLANRTLDLNAGSYTITGQVANLLASRILDLAQGSYSITGQDASLLRGFSLSLDAGSYTVTGNNPTLIISRVIGLELGSYTITGLDVSFSYSGAGIEVPVTRIFIIEQDNRILAITSENRTFSVENENRTFGIVKE